MTNTLATGLNKRVSQIVMSQITSDLLKKFEYPMFLMNMEMQAALKTQNP